MKVNLYAKSLGLVLMLVIFLAGCPIVEPDPDGDGDGDPTPTFNGTVFDDGFTAVAKESVDFWNGDNGFTIGDEFSEYKEGNSSLFIDWTNVKATEGEGDGYAWNGMAVVAKPAMEQDLSAYNALTLWARAAGDSTVNIDKFGFAAGTDYELSLNGVALDSTWKQLILRIPDSSVFTSVSNLFYAVDAAPGGKIFIDDVKFEILSMEAHYEN